MVQGDTKTWAMDGRPVLARLNALRGSWLSVVMTVLAVLVAVGLSSVLITTTGGSPSKALDAVYRGSLANAAALTLTLLFTAPLLLVAVGSCVSARAGVFNIGQEGQVLVGALAGAYVALRIAVAGPLLLVLVVVAAAAGGAVWAGLSALMNQIRGVNVVVSTLLMTFVAQQLIGYAVSTSWFLQESRVGTAVVDSQSNQLPKVARLGSIGQYPDLQINGGLILAVAVTALIAVAVAKTRWGFRVKLLGLNPSAARHSGVRVAALGGLALAISGATAGLAGAVLVASPVGSNRLQPGVSNNIGWDGLLVALVARNRPVLCVPVALLFGVLRSGGNSLASIGVPVYLVDVVKGLLVLALVAPSVATDLVQKRRAQSRLAGIASAPRKTMEEVAA